MRDTDLMGLSDDGLNAEGHRAEGYRPEGLSDDGVNDEGLGDHELCVNEGPSKHANHTHDNGNHTASDQGKCRISVSETHADSHRAHHAFLSWWGLSVSTLTLRLAFA